MIDFRIGIPTSGGDLHWDRCSSLSEYLIHCRAYFDTELSQVAKSISASQRTLATIFERIESFSRRPETYTEVLPTIGMTHTIVKIMVEVLSILSIATKEIKQSKASELSFRLVVCPYRLKVVQRNMLRSWWEGVI